MSVRSRILSFEGKNTHIGVLGMKKLVVLKLDGDLSHGVRVTLEIGEEDSRPTTEITAQLPSASELVTVIDQWHSTYRSLGKSSRLEAKKIVYGGSIAQWREDCEKSAVDLRSRLNNWLKSESFRPIREKWLQQLSPSDEVRVLIRTSSMPLRKLPWHLWDLIEDYPNTEVAYSTPESELRTLSKTPTYRDKVRILAILGNSTGINVQKDRQLLENLPDAATTFLVEPQRQDINDQLWNQPWDILFFAGHSKTEGNTGRIFINQNDYLTIGELKYALSNAVKNGLQLAIFNSCDGLGLALDLQHLHIPQIIVMREPVPDQVAQAFLTYFLAAFAGGKSFYQAECEARLKLHGLEDKFPCASWLPMIFQNPAVLPPMWQDLGRRPTEVCPYRGLFAFREEDAPFFKGREAFTQMLVEAVQQQSLVAVIGPSGSGKSSVVFAGLIPQLRLGAKDIAPLYIVSFRPGDRPFRNLATKLVPLLETQMSETDQLLEINKLATAMRQGDLTLRDVVTRLLEKNSGDRLLLVADQFEELYTLCRDAQERLLFLDSLLEVSDRTPNFTLVITLRADFLGQALSYRPFGDALQYADLKLSPMNREELQAAVEQPAMMLGVTIESGLMERILDAVSAEPGDLPLLEFALNQLWAKQRDAQLTHAAYEEIGGVEAALARYAEEAYDNLNEEEKERARRLFIQLVRPGEGTEDTRRLATRTEVGEENWDLITRLADARLVVSSRDEAAGEETVEIVHEALIGGWERLGLWIELDRSFRTWQERLRVSLRQWETSDRDEGALLRGAPLAEAEGWLQSRPVEVSAAERVFIQLSLELRDREHKEQERRRQRTIMGLVGGLGAVSILAVGAFWQWQRAEIGRTSAELSNLSTTSETLFASNQEFEALIESIRAGRQLKRALGVKPDTRMQVVLALQQAVYGVRERNRFEGRRVSFSPDGKMLATVIDDGTIQLLSLDGRKIRTLRKPDDSNFSDVSFSLDGKMLASATENGTVELWSVDGTLLKTFKEPGKRDTGELTMLTKVVSFSPGGKMLASATENGTVKLWSLDGTLLKTFKGRGGGRVKGTETTVSFSPDGKMLAVVSSDQTMALWNTNGTLLKVLEGYFQLESEFEGVRSYDASEFTTDVSFSPDGKVLAIANSKTVKLLSANGTLLKTLTADLTDGEFRSLSFSPNGKMLAVVVGGNTVKFWSIDNGKFKTLDLKLNSDRVTSLSFSPDGKMLATISNWDNKVKLWKLDGLEPKILEEKDTEGAQFITKLSLSPDSKTIAGVSFNRTVKLWNHNGALLKTLSSNNKHISSLTAYSPISFSSNSRVLASFQDETIKLWSTDGTLLKTFKKPGTDPGDRDSGATVFYDLSLNPDGKILASGSLFGTITLWNIDGREIKTLWNTDGREIKTLRHNEQKTRGKLPTERFIHPVTVSFSPDGKTLASVDSFLLDTTVKLWSREGSLLKTFRLERGRIADRVIFSPDGRTIALNISDNTVKLWSIDGREIKTLKGHNSPVQSVSFSPDGKTIASHSGDGTVKLWSINGRELKTFKSQSGSEITTMSLSPDGKMLALAHRDGTVILKSLDLDELLVLGCDWLDGYLRNSPDVSKSDKHLCDGIGTQKIQ
jgi:WD40 repeat protein